MFLQGVFRIVFVSFLAIQIRTVQAEEPLVSLARHDTDMMFSRGDRRRWGWFKKLKKKAKKTFRWVKRWYYRTHPAKLRKCKKRCLLTSLRCLKLYAKCLAKCVAICYIRSKYRTYVRKRIWG